MYCSSIIGCVNHARINYIHTCIAYMQLPYFILFTVPASGIRQVKSFLKLGGVGRMDIFFKVSTKVTRSVTGSLTVLE